MTVVDAKEMVFDTEPVRFRHSLRDEPLLSFSALADAVAENQKIAAYHGSVGPERDAGWHSLYDAPKKIESVVEALNNLAEASAWVRVRLNEDARYAPLISSILDELSDICHCPLKKLTSIRNVTVFLQSPNAITPYHFDHEANFFFQIAGKKTLTVYDGRLPEVLTREELRNFYISGLSSHRPEVEAYAQPFELGAGDGLHFPSLWPHWVRTGDEVSISLSLNISVKRRDVAARVYQCNYYLKRLGLNPKPIGKSKWSDALKKFVLADPFSGRFTTTHDVLRHRLNRIHVPIVIARKLAHGVGYVKSHLHLPFSHG